MFEDYNWSGGNSKIYHATAVWLENGDGTKLSVDETLKELLLSREKINSQYSLMYGDLLPPNCLTTAQESVCIPIDGYFLDLSSSVQDLQHGLWFTSIDGAQFKVDKFMNNTDNDCLAQIMLTIDKCNHRLERAPLRQPLRYLFNASVHDVNGSLCSDLNALNPNSTALSLKGQLMNQEQFDSVLIRARVNRYEIKLACAKETPCEFTVQDMSGAWYLIKSFSPIYLLTAHQNIDRIASSIKTTFDWPSVRSNRITRCISNFIVVNDDGDMVSPEDIASLSSVVSVNLHGTLLPYESPTAQLHISVQVSDFSIEWAADGSIFAYNVISIDGVHYRLNVPTHFAYSELMYELNCCCNELKKLVNIVKKISAHAPQSSSLICNKDVLQLCRDNHIDRGQFEGPHAQFVAKQLLAVGLSAQDTLIKSTLALKYSSLTSSKAPVKVNVNDVISTVMLLVAQLDTIPTFSLQNSMHVDLLHQLRYHLRRIPYLFKADREVIVLQNVPKATRHNLRLGVNPHKELVKTTDVYLWSIQMLERVDTLLTYNSKRL